MPVLSTRVFLASSQFPFYGDRKNKKRDLPLIRRSLSMLVAHRMKINVGLLSS